MYDNQKLKKKIKKFCSDNLQKEEEEGEGEEEKWKKIKQKRSNILWGIDDGSLCTYICSMVINFLLQINLS